MIAKGNGRPILFIHGSATDHQTWTLQLAGLQKDFRVVAYDRFGESYDFHTKDHATIARQAQTAVGILEKHSKEPWERSADFYGDTLEALHAVIPRATLHVLPQAGHMMHVDAHRTFNELIRGAVRASMS